MATILTKKKDTTGAPSAGDLTNSTGGAELAVNTADKRLYTKNSSNAVVEVGTNPGEAVTFVAGSASTPAITTTGDTNTGIFFPAADTIAFAEGGAEAARLDSSGNFGLGATPATTFSGHSYFQIGAQAALAANKTLSATGQTYLSHNLYYDTSGTLQVFNTTNANEGCLYQQLDGIHVWSSSAATTGTPTVSERMRIDNSGNVGIGTSSPTLAKLVVSGSGPSNSIMTNTVASLSGGGNALQIGDDGTDVLIGVGDSGTNLSFLSRVAGVYTKAMTLTSGGDLLVGTTSGTGSGRQELIVGGNAGGTYIGLGRSGTNKANIQLDSGDNLSIQNTASQPINVVATTNGVTLTNGATSWASASDERKKDIIEPITDGLNKVTSLRSVIGKYKTDDESARRVFLIAQDVQAVLPEAVQEDKEGNLLLTYTDLIPLLVSAVKDLKAELDTVKAELATLKG